MQKIFRISLFKDRRLYSGLLFLFCLAVLFQLMVILPLSVDDKESEVVEESAKPPPQARSADSPGDQKMSRIHMLETREGAKDWELWSDNARSVPEDEVVILNGVDSLFHGKEGMTYRVKGQEGMIEVPRKNLSVSGKVETRTSNGYTFFTDDMKYSSSDRILSTQSPVRVEGPRTEGKKALKLTGNGLRTTLDESRVEVLENVRAEKILEKGQRAVIRSDRARFDGKSTVASFQGKVVLDVDDMRITGPKADFLYDSTGDILKSVLFSGGARVSDPNKWATSDQVKVDFQQDQYIFSGDPRVVQNSDELRGEKIIFHNGGKRIEVIRAKAKIDKGRLEGNN